MKDILFKKSFILILILWIIGCFSAKVVFAGEVQVYLDGPTGTIEKGTNFSVKVHMNGEDVSFNSVVVQVNYDNKKLEVKDVKVNAQHSSELIEQNYILMAGIWVNDYHLNGDYIFAEINFTAKEDTNIQDAVSIDEENTDVAGGNYTVITDREFHGEEGPTSITLENPLTATSFADFVGTIASYIRDIALVIAIIMFLWSGFLFLTSQGNEEKVSKAKKALGWAVVGLAICIIGEGFRFILEQLFE